MLIKIILLLNYTQERCCSWKQIAHQCSAHEPNQTHLYTSMFPATHKHSHEQSKLRIFFFVIDEIDRGQTQRTCWSNQASSCVSKRDKVSQCHQQKSSREKYLVTCCSSSSMKNAAALWYLDSLSPLEDESGITMKYRKALPCSGADKYSFQVVGFLWFICNWMGSTPVGVKCPRHIGTPIISILIKFFT